MRLQTQSNVLTDNAIDASDGTHEWDDLCAGSEEYRAGFLLIAIMTLVDIALLLVLNLKIKASDLIQPIGVTGLLLGVTGFYGLRREPRFVASCLALLQLVLFSTTYTLMMYSVTTLNRPTIDQALGAFDATIGLETQRVVMAVSSIPWLSSVLSLCYSTVMIQTALAIVVLGFTGKISALRIFVLRFMTSSCICLVIYSWFPAVGPFSCQELTLRADQQRFIEHFGALRDGSMRTISWIHAEGLITFPSFHTVWAILLIVAARHHRYAFIPALIINIAIVVSTVSTGWHYFADVICGALVAAVICRAIADPHG